MERRNDAHCPPPQPDRSGRARSRRGLRGVAGCLVAVAATGCQLIPSLAPASGTPHPVAQVPRIASVTVGATRLSVAYEFSTAKERTHGLMGTTLPPGSAAVFTWGGATTSDTFWMMDTPEALSLLWVAAGKVVGHAEMTRCALSCPVYKAPNVYDTAVEAPAGTFAAVKAGQAVSFR